MREAASIAATLARELRNTRRRRQLKQSDLADAVGVSQSEISRLESGAGARTSIETWIALGIALDRSIAIAFGRDVVEPVRDAGHLAAQELVIRIASAGGWHVSFEVPVDARLHGLTTDLMLDDRDEHLVLAEIWNRLDDFGAAVRSSDRKLAQARATGRRRTVGGLWLLVDSAANRAIVRRYPGVLQVRFRGSSLGWIRAIEGGGPAPVEPGLVWIDLRSGRLRPVRLAADALR